MSINAARRFFPRRSSSAVLCRAVRAGQVSKRKKMTRIVAAITSATSVSAIGHAMRYGFADFDIRRWALSVSVQTQSSKSKIRSKKKAANVWALKNYRPPHQIGVKGGCSPQNNRRKLSSLVSEVASAGNKILQKIFTKISPDSAVRAST